jgi:DAK2 domain fusion protein YloV
MPLCFVQWAKVGWHEPDEAAVSILYVDGRRMRRSIVASLKWLVAKQALLNKLNVYPVPDGDTGTNMVLTLKSAVESIGGSDDELAALTKSLSDGALLGARGNSGVILSQIIRGFTDGLAGKKRMDVRELAESFNKAVERAYTAIANPVEGTILTVLRESAREAAATAESDPDIIHYLERLHDEAVQSLERTPDMLPALKEAGVVDSGAMGFVCIVEGILRLIRGEDLDAQVSADMQLSAGPVITESYAGPRFCTEFILHCGDDGQTTLREFLQGRGESLVFVADTGLARVHIHSDEPAEILRFARGLGEVSREKVDDMKSQHEHLFTPAAAAEPDPPVAVGLFCTAPGEGFAKVFRSLGVSQVLIAGDTNNPSVEEILKTAKGVRARELVFLPNNRNIILAGEQAAAASKRPMTILNTKTVIQGVAAAVCFDADAPLEEMCAEMRMAMGHVKTLAVTRAVRDSSLNGIQIRAGEYFSILDGEGIMTGEDADTVLMGSLEKAAIADEAIAVYYGSDVAEERARALGDALSAAHPEAEIEVHEGGQPHYPYIVSIE